MLCRLLACSLAMGRLSVVSRVFFRNGEDRMLAGQRRWGAHHARVSLQLVTVGRLGMFLANPLALPGPRSWLAAVGPDYRPVSLGS